MEGEIPPGGIWFALATAIAGGVWTTLQYIQKRNEKQLDAPRASPVGDLRVWGAALNDSGALHRLGEAVEDLRDCCRQSSKHQEMIAVALTQIAGVMMRQEESEARRIQIEKDNEIQRLRRIVEENKLHVHEKPLNR